MSRWFEVWGLLLLLGGRKQRSRQERKARRAEPRPRPDKDHGFLESGFTSSCRSELPAPTVQPEISGSPQLVFNKPKKSVKLAEMH